MGIKRVAKGYRRGTGGKKGIVWDCIPEKSPKDTGFCKVGRVKQRRVCKLTCSLVYKNKNIFSNFKKINQYFQQCITSSLIKQTAPKPFKDGFEAVYTGSRVVDESVVPSVEVFNRD